MAVVVGVLALAWPAPALAAVRSVAHGVLTPVQRFAPPTLGWQPVVPRNTAFEAESESDQAPKLRGWSTAAAMPKQVTRLRRATQGAATAYVAQPRFAGASSYAAGNLDPADVQLAVGAGDVVQLVNIQMNVWTTGGVLLKTMSLDDLIGSQDRLVDPRILFDAVSGRWFVITTDVTYGDFGIKIGVSQTADPTGAWWFYTYDSPSTSSACLDQPRIGYSSQLVTFSANVYAACSSYVGTELWALNKAQLVAGQQAAFQSWAPTPDLWSVEPVQSLTPSDAQYGAAVSNSLLRVIAVTGVPPAAASYTTSDLTIAPLADPPNAVQASAPDLIDTGTVRTFDAAWSNGTLWVSAPDACIPPGDTRYRACGRVFTATTSPMQLVDDRALTIGPGSYVYYPAVRPDGDGNAVVVFGYSSATQYPSVGVTTRAASGGWSAWTSVAAGTSAQTSGRWGDYFGAAADPGVAGRVWVSGQVGAEVEGTSPGHGWQTTIASVTPAAAGPAKVTYPAAAVRSVTKTSAIVSGSVDPSFDDTSYRFEYGRTIPYRFATAWTPLTAPAQPQTVTATLKNLLPNTRYHVRLVAKNSSGTTAGDDRTFKTKPKPKPKPKKKPG